MIFWWIEIILVGHYIVGAERRISGRLVLKKRTMLQSGSWIIQLWDFSFQMAHLENRIHSWLTWNDFNCQKLRPMKYVYDARFWREEETSNCLIVIRPIFFEFLFSTVLPNSTSIDHKTLSNSRLSTPSVSVYII